MAARADCDSNARNVFDACFVDVMEDRKTLNVFWCFWVILLRTNYYIEKKHKQK